MTDISNKAVFLSYASQDAEAARRICEALRAAGVEVWFDQSELVGGDAWDAKIRGQIAACALFVPVISAATQARREGYFRLEWKLAAQRTHMIADGTPFLLPVVIDGTRDADALVPAEFKGVQWTRLAGGEPAPAFTARVQSLLGAVEDAAPATAGGTAAEVTVRREFRRELLPLLALVAIVAAVLVPWLARRGETGASSGAERPSSNAPALNDKSIAVLPFANLSAEKENEFFADGVHAEVLAHLQNIRELRVVSHQSVIGYRGTTKKSPVIGGELGVAYLLGGSVRRAGNVVRVSVQLIDARGDTQIWSLPPRDRTLDNIFAIQSEIANATARALQAALSPDERSQLELKPTENTEAYDLFLRARELRFRSPFTRSTTRQMTAWLQRAVELDPKFARAWTELSGVLLETHFLGFDLRPERLVEAKAALDEAIKLAPQTIDTQLAVARYSYQGLRDYDRALAQCAAVAALHPNNPQVIRLPAVIQRRQGRWPEALANLRIAVALDRGDVSLLRNLVQTLRAVRRWDEALPAQRRLVEIVNGASREAYNLGELSFLANGSTKEMEDLIRELERKFGASSEVIAEKKRWARLRGDFAEAIRLDEQQTHFDEENLPRSRQAAPAALTLLATGDTTAARARLAGFPIELRSELRERPDDLRLMANLAVMEIVLGNGAEAVRLQEAALAELEKSDLWSAASFRAQLAGMLAWAGQKERALDALRRSLLEADGARVHEVRHSALFTPLRGDPEFERLLADPKNNAPLF